MSAAPALAEVTATYVAPKPAPSLTDTVFSMVLHFCWGSVRSAFGAVEPWAIFFLESVTALLFVVWLVGQMRSRCAQTALDTGLHAYACFCGRNSYSVVTRNFGLSIRHVLATAALCELWSLRFSHYPNLQAHTPTSSDRDRDWNLWHGGRDICDFAKP